MDVTVDAKISRNGFLRSGECAEEGGLAPAVAGEEEMSAASEINLLPKASEWRAVANFKTGVEMDGWSLLSH